MTQPPKPPAELAWETTEDGLLKAEHDGTTWFLATHSVHRGKSGWSGSDEWHLHKLVGPDSDDEVGWTLGAIPVDHGRWLARPRKLKRAKTLAAWLVTNPYLYEVAVLGETERHAFPKESS